MRTPGNVHGLNPYPSSYQPLRTNNSRFMTSPKNCFGGQCGVDSNYNGCSTYQGCANNQCANTSANMNPQTNDIQQADGGTQQVDDGTQQTDGSQPINNQTQNNENLEKINISGHTQHWNGEMQAEGCNRGNGCSVNVGILDNGQNSGNIKVEGNAIYGLDVDEKRDANGKLDPKSVDILQTTTSTGEKETWIPPSAQEMADLRAGKISSAPWRRVSVDGDGNIFEKGPDGNQGGNFFENGLNNNTDQNGVRPLTDKNGKTAINQDTDTTNHTQNNGTKSVDGSTPPKGVDPKKYAEATKTPNIEAFNKAVASIRSRMPAQLHDAFDKACDFLKKYDQNDSSYSKDDTRMTNELRNQIMNYMTKNANSLNYSVKADQDPNVGGTYLSNSNHVTITPTTLKRGTAATVDAIVHESTHACGDLTGETCNESRAIIAGVSFRAPGILKKYGISNTGMNQAPINVDKISKMLAFAGQHKATNIGPDGRSTTSYRSEDISRALFT